MIRLGVTGTDTGVGKTTVGRALVGAMRADGWRVAAMKPVETGVAPDDPASDAHALSAAAGGLDAMHDVCPITLAEPLAPWMAARRANRVLSVASLDASFVRIAAGADAVLVEGAGGVLVPITLTDTYLSLFQRWCLDAIVVAANRLGAVNHTLLTVRALQQGGVDVLGVVLNETADDEPDLARRTNRETIQALLPDTPVVSFPWLPAPTNDADLARAVATAGLRDLLLRATQHQHIEEGLSNR